MLVAQDFILLIFTWTYTSDASLVVIQNSLKAPICLSSFFLKVFLKLLLGTRPFFTLYSYFKQTYIWCNVSCNVWLCMNEMSEHLNSFFIWICFIPLFRIHCSSLPLCSSRACFSNLLCFFSLFWKGILRPDAFYRITTFLCSEFESCDSLIPSSLENK